MPARFPLLALLLTCLFATSCAAQPAITSLVPASETAATSAEDTSPPPAPAPAPEVSRDEAISILASQAFLNRTDASCVVDSFHGSTGTYNMMDSAVEVDTRQLIESCVAGEEEPAAAVIVVRPPSVPIENELRVLFVGNSYTHYNNMPGTVNAITSAYGTKLIPTMKAPGGYFLSDHINDGEVEEELASGEYDVVVIQEQSVALSLNPERYDLTMPYATQLDAAADDAGVRVIWYQTWGRENGMADVGFETYEQMQQGLIQGYGELAESTGGDIARVGESWQRIRANDADLDLYTDDGSHPSKIGSYVAAIGIAEAILEMDLEDAPAAGGVGPDTVAAIFAAEAP